MGLQNPYNIGMQDPNEFSLIGDNYIPLEDPDEGLDPFSSQFYDPGEVSRIKDNISQLITDGGQRASIYEGLFDSDHVGENLGRIDVMKIQINESLGEQDERITQLLGNTLKSINAKEFQL